MSYSKPSGPHLLLLESNPTQLAYNATSSTFVCVKRCLVKRVKFSVIVDTDADVAVSVNSAPSIGGAQTLRSTLNLLASETPVLGETRYEDVTPFIMEVGDELKFTSDGGGTTAEIVCSAEVEDLPEEVLNESGSVVTT